MCVCTCCRSSAIKRWAAFANNCVRENDVTPWTSVANNTETTSGRSIPVWCLVTTLSIRNFEEYGNTNPATLLITISTKPSASRPRRGRISFHTSGRMAFSLLTFGGCTASLAGELNLLFDSAGAEFASLLLHCHTFV